MLIAPLAEQRRIVEAIETQLTRLDAGVASLKAAQAKLRRYRASVLKAACEGRLVAQDSSDEPASVLLARIKAARQERADSPAKNGRRGRPRKAESDVHQSPGVTTEAKGRRGRPPRADSAAQASDDPAPRRRGRPRKEAAQPTGRPLPASEPVGEAEQLRIDGIE